jgi:uncharacterized protein (TIGR02996 family)
VARFERDGRFVELWLEPSDRFPVLRRREGAIDREAAAPATTVALEYEYSFKRTYCEQAVELLVQGWQWVRDPARDPALPEEPISDALEAALRVGEAGAELVYADWLQQRGHPRGELIQLQHALEHRPGVPELEAAVRALLDSHADALLGPLAARIAEPGAHHEAFLQLAWRRGFIEAARIGGFHDRGESEQIVCDLLRHPSARCLRGLEIGCHQSGDQNNRMMCALIANIDPAPPLRRLVLADFDHTFVDQIDISRAPLGDLRGLGQRYPALEDVQLKGTGHVDLGELALPNAHRFALRTSSLCQETLAAIAAAPWPRLEELELWFGDPADGYGAECGPDDLADLLAAELPRLRVLRLMNAAFSDEIVPRLAACRLAPQLEVIDFSLGTLSDSGADQLASLRSAFPRLGTVAVYDCALTDRGLARLRDASLAVDEEPASRAERQCLAWRQASTTAYTRWRDPRRTQKTYRFVTEAE